MLQKLYEHALCKSVLTITLTSTASDSSSIFITNFLGFFSFVPPDDDFLRDFDFDVLSSASASSACITSDDSKHTHQQVNSHINTDQPVCIQCNGGKVHGIVQVWGHSQLFLTNWPLPHLRWTVLNMKTSTNFPDLTLKWQQQPV